jgi:glycosyltransferase involved in cell wall biosynthesis
MEISVVINTKNEETSLERCLKSASWADEIVVMDMNSADATVAIARRYTDKVFSCPDAGYVEPARQLAIENCTKPWVFVLDADEVIPKFLAENIRGLITRFEDFALIAIPRKNYIGNYLIQDSGWGADQQPRLFQREKVKWGTTIHAWPRVHGEIKRLDAEDGFYIEHYAFEDISDFVDRVNGYTGKEAETLLQSGRPFEWRDLLHATVKEFSKRYTPGVDGFHSMMLAGSMAFYRFLTYCKALEKLRSTNPDLSFRLPENLREILGDIGNLPVKLLESAEGDAGTASGGNDEDSAEASILETELAKAKKQYSAEKLKFLSVVDSRIFKLTLFLSGVFAGIRKPFELAYRLFKRTRRLELATPLPRCLGIDGTGYIAGKYRLRREEPAPVVLVRVGGRDWECKVEPVNKERKQNKGSPMEFRFSCEFAVRGGPGILQLLHSRPCLRSKELLAASLVWAEPPAWAPKPFRQSGAAKLSFPAPEAPLVSIIIPVEGNRGATIRCLDSVMANSRNVDYEVIIAACGCGKPLMNRLSSIPGLRISAFSSEKGAAENYNDAISLARGKYVHFLGGDTEVKTGWLMPLVDIFARFRDAGAVGSMVIDPLGSLIEAGGVVWRDGSRLAYGKDDDPGNPKFNYVKEVDYCSGSSLLVDRQIFGDVGGFSPEFAPASYGCIDLAFKIRAAGRKVYYQPASQVARREPVALSGDFAPAADGARFALHWKTVLKAGHQPRGIKLLRARERSQNRKLAVFFDGRVPLFDQDAGSRSTFQYIELFLNAGMSVKFIGNDFKVWKPYTGLLQQMGVEVLYGEWYSRNILQWLERYSADIDVIFSNRAKVTAKYIAMFRSLDHARILFYGHDIASLRLRQRFKLTRDPAVQAEAEAEAEMEMKAWTSVDAIYYPSSEEIAYVRSKVPGANAKVIPLNICEPLAEDYSGTLAERRDLLFVGGFRHHPNEDAVLAFLDHCWPLLETRIPDCKFYIVGGHPPDSILARASNRILVTGWISDADLDALYRRVRLTIVPLRYGAGVKGKVVESVRHNVPLVLTPAAASGLAGIESCGVIASINPDPADFALAVARLFSDDAALSALSAACSPFLEARFSAAAARDALAFDLPWLGVEYRC